MNEVQGNVTTLTCNLSALSQKVNEVTSSISKMAGNIGSVTQDMQKLGSQVKADNLNLQDTLIDKVQNLFKEFKTDLVETSGKQDSPAARNVRHASSTLFHATTLPTRTVRIQAEEPDVTTTMQDILEASNNITLR